MNATYLINKLGLKQHPEGGYYSETYKSRDVVLNRNSESRSASTAIYFLLEGEDKSHFHRIQSDELWFFHFGQPLEIVSIEDGVLNSIIFIESWANFDLMSILI